MNSPLPMRIQYYMARKNKQNKQVRIKPNKNAKRKGASRPPTRQLVKSTFSSEGGDIGSRLGRLAGTALGSVIGKIFGHGDYQINAPVGHNTLANRGDIPQFTTSTGSNRIVHREYIGDVISSATAKTFNNTSYPINPGLVASFPWLAAMASSFTQYRVNGLVYEFKSTSGDALTSTDTTLGAVIMATNYDPTQASFGTKQDMENAEYSMSCKPSLNMIHAVECAPSSLPIQELYVRSGSVTTDLRFTDIGNFQVATTGVQGTSVNLGELWVSFDITFLKPKIPLTFGGNIQSQMMYRTASGTSTGIPSTLSTSTGNLVGFTVVATPTTSSVSFTATAGSQYIVNYYLVAQTAILSGSAANVGFFNSNTAARSIMVGGTKSNVPQNAQPATTFELVSQNFIYAINAGTIGLTYSAGFSWTGSATANIFVSQIDDSVS